MKTKSRLVGTVIFALLVILVASLVLLSACTAPASPTTTLTPTPTPKTVTPSPTPIPSPKPTSPIGQTEQKIEDGWVRLVIENTGSIDYPTDFLELQSQDYRDMGKGIYQLLVDKSDFTLQQAGLNEMKPSAFSEYRRVMFKTVYLNRGEEVFRAKEKYTLSQKELAEFKNELINELRQANAKLKAIGQDDKIIDSVSLEIMEINGMFPLVRTYKRQLNDNPIVLVKYYIFWNYNRIHHLILSYRVMDEDKSRDIYRKILYSFRLKN